MARTTVLIIEDDPSIRRGLVDALSFGGFGVIECDNGTDGLARAIECAADLVLLDVMLPGQDGFSVLKEIRAARPTLPVIMVTARGGENDRVNGLAGGADDYVVKPFSARELLARVQAVLRRSPERPTDVREICIGEMSIDLERGEVSCATNGARQLSDRETSILRYLAVRQGHPVTRDELLHRVWGLNPRGLQTRTVDMHIARLREKIGDGDGSIIRTVRARGYMLSDDAKVGDA